MFVPGLDAGHGGIATGARHNGIVEADWNMSFVRTLTSKILKSGDPFDPLLIRRHDDETMSLMDRGGRSHETGCDLVLSFHVNAARQRHFHGCLGFHMPNDRVGREVSNTILRCWPKPLYRPGWGSFAAVEDDSQEWLERPRSVIEVHECPAVLIEVGYCSNERDAQFLMDPATQDAMVPAVLAGLARFRQLHDEA